jgi:CheY-like chemotaxis protein
VIPYLVVMLLAALATAAVAVTRTRAARAALGASEETCRLLEQRCHELEQAHSKVLDPFFATHGAGAIGLAAVQGLVKATVLVVDDDSRVRDLAKLILVRAGHDVVAVAGPHDALAVLNRQPDIDLLLIDVVMPEMNGYDFAAEARKIVPSAHIIFMSGFACDMNRHPAANGFLAKPFTIESLTNVVQQVVSSGPSAVGPLH